MKKIVFIAIFMVTGALSAQITFNGIIKDSIGNPLEMANVIALDTVAKRVASYGFSDDIGQFISRIWVWE